MNDTALDGMFWSLTTNLEMTGISYETLVCRAICGIGKSSMCLLLLFKVDSPTAGS